MLCTVHVYFTMTGCWGWGRRSTTSWPVPHNIHMLKPRPPGLQIMTTFGVRAFKGVHAYMCARSVMSHSSRPHGLPTRILCPWDSAGKNTRVGFQFLLQGIFPTQGLNLCLLSLLQWQENSLLLNHLGSSFKGVINLKWGSEWNLIHSDQYPYQQRKFGHTRKHQRWVNMEDRPRRGHSKKAAIRKPRREASEEIKSAKAKRLDFQKAGLPASRSVRK